MSPVHRSQGADRWPGAPLDAADDLGESALAQLLARTPDGVVVTDPAGRCTYANPVACRWLGDSVTETPGHGVPSLLLTERGAGSPHSTSRLIDQDGVVRDIAYATSTVALAGGPHVVTVFRDLTAPLTAAREAVALAQTVAQLAGTSPTNQVLAGIARHAVEGTRALMAGFSVLGPDHKLGVGGAFGPGGISDDGASPAWVALNQARGEDVIAAMTGGSSIAGASPGRVVVWSDARSSWEADPLMAGFAQALSSYDWKAAICVPLAWQNRVVGVFGAYLPKDVTVPTEAELAFCQTLADQAAIAVSTAQLSNQARHAAALAERSRLARELHDSVSQALFSMTMHARAAELSLAKADVDLSSPLRRSVSQLAELARTTSAEMRALIFELRPEPASDTVGVLPGDERSSPYAR